MTSKPKQLGLLDKQTLVLQHDDADIEYTANYLSSEQATTLFARLMVDTEWRQETVQVYGKAHLTPRLSCWMGDAGLTYQYSNLVMQPTPWSAAVKRVRDMVESTSGEKFNSVLLNRYRNGADSNGWHSDDEPELGDEPVIASLSLGAARDFRLRHKQRPALSHTLTLGSGSLLIMRGATQRYWQHQIPKRARAEERINLTFRYVFKTRN